MKHVNAAIAIVAIMIFSLACVSALQEVPDLRGQWHAEGVGPEGPYIAKVGIGQRGRVVFIRWNISPDEQYEGFGMIAGDTLVASSIQQGAYSVSMIYKIQGDTLTGEWPEPEEAQIWTETLKRVTSSLNARR